MLNIRNHKLSTLVACLLMASTMQSFAGNKLEILADIQSIGECDIEVTPSNIEITRRPVVGDFRLNDAVDITPIKLSYQCRDYETTVMPEVMVTGDVSNDPNLFLTENPAGAKGVGFMLKNGEVSELVGFYSKGKTLKNNESFYLPAGSTKGSLPMTIGFVRQADNSTVTAGSAKASILLTVVMP
ncbi:TPA: fimbrial protein [Providencia stuartii]